MGGWSLDKKIISIYMGNPDNSNHAELELPATPWEMVDAMDRLRLSEGQEPYWQVEDMGRYEFLAPHLDGYDLYQFNALAEKLRTFSDVDAVAFEGLVQMELNNLYQNNGGELTLRRVLDLAYSVDCCHVVPGITDDAALGQFYVENDFLPDLATVPDSVLEMLDYEKIGRSMREGEGGVLTPHGYVMQESELRQAPSNLGCREWDSWQEVRLEECDAAMPEMWRFTDMAYDGMEQINRFAQCLEELDRNNELIKFKAVAGQLDISGLDDMFALAEHLSEYALEPGIHSLEGLAREELSVIVSDPARDLLTRHLNMEAYGADLLWRDQGLFSDYGYICRPDGQPLQLPQQGMDMTMQ